MRQLPKFNNYGKTLYLQDYDVLIVSDIHFGICRTIDNINAEKQYNDKYNRLNSIISELNPDKLILNGDTFYNPFNETNPLKEDDMAISILHKLDSSVDEFIMLEGNHELTLGGFTENIKNSFNVGYSEKVDDILIHHGHNEPTEEANHQIIGHMHPRLDGNDIFHYSESGYNDASVIILPAFCNFVDGVDIRYYGGLCPVFDNGIDATEYNNIKLD